MARKQIRITRGRTSGKLCQCIPQVTLLIPRSAERRTPVVRRRPRSPKPAGPPRSKPARSRRCWCRATATSCRSSIPCDWPTGRDGWAAVPDPSRWTPNEPPATATVPAPIWCSCVGRTSARHCSTRLRWAISPFCDAPLANSEWVLHAASQDLPCLADTGMRPRSLFDTELAGRLAGLPRVGLGPLVEQMLGLGLPKGHGAADWSTRPLPHDMADLRRPGRRGAGRTARCDGEAARFGRASSTGPVQEFAAIVAAPPAPPRVDPWRRTSGIHKVRDPRVLAIMRELWTARDSIAGARDLAPHRVLPDTAIMAAATASPIPSKRWWPCRYSPGGSSVVSRRPGGTRSAGRWRCPRASSRRPPCPATDRPRRRNGRSRNHEPRPGWRRRVGLAEMSGRVSTPVENLISPDLVRRTMWAPPDGADLAAALAAGGARPWQVELTTDALRTALDASVPPQTDPLTRRPASRPASPPAGINFDGADEVVHSHHSRPERAQLIRAGKVDPRDSAGSQAAQVTGQ